MKKSKKRQPYVDDGHTVYSMDGLTDTPKTDKQKRATLTKKERKTAMKAAFEYYFPYFLMVVGCFALVMLLLQLWLK